MIQIENISKHYDDIIAVKNLSIQICEGEVCTMLGPSGCGKSTTLRMINRLILPTEGQIYYQGKNINDFPVEELRYKMGYVVQSVGLFPHMSTFENISITPKLQKWDSASIKRRANDLLELVGLNPEIYANKYPSELSGGEAQRVGVARALAADPPILLMDEPFGAVDPLNRLRLQNEFLKIQRNLNKTIVFVTHDIEEAIKMSDKIAIMDKGVLQDFDTPKSLIMQGKTSFVRSFLGKEYALKILSKYFVEDYMEINTNLLNSFNFTLKKGDTLTAALSQMIEYGFEALPIVDESGIIIGEINIGNILNALKTDHNSLGEN